MSKHSTESSVRKSNTTKGAKVAEKRWEKDGEREDQDYYHIPGSPKVDHEEAASKTGRRRTKSR